MNAVLYLRVSTVAQAVDGYGLDAQEAACREYARRVGIRVVGVHRDEGVSGTREAADRPGLLDALGALEDGAVDVLLVARIDRLARSLTVQEAVLANVWKEKQRAVHSADTGEIVRDDPDDPMRTFVRQVMGAAAQLDRGMTVKRMKDGRLAKAARGGRAVGPAPYGYRPHRGALAPVPDEQDALTVMRAMRSEGATTRAIADALAAEGYPTKRGGTWTSPVVSRILSRDTPPDSQIVDPLGASVPTDHTKDIAAPHAA